MQQIYRTVVGNTSPNVVILCQRGDDIIDLTNASTVVLIIKNERTGTTTNAGSSCTVNTPATDGAVTYVPVAGDFPTEDRFLGDVKITFSSGKIENLYDLILFPARNP